MKKVLELTLNTDRHVWRNNITGDIGIELINPNEPDRRIKLVVSQLNSSQLVKQIQAMLLCE